MKQLKPLFRRRYSKPGASPGSLVHDGEHVAPRIHVIRYGADTLEEWDADERTVLDATPVEGCVTWIDIQGIGDGTLVRALGELLGLHRLAVSDVVNVGQRPKADDYDNSMFFVVRMVALQQELHLHWEQVGIFLLPGLVLTFQESYGDCLDPLRERIRGGRKAVRESGADYLACMVIDAIVDGYFPVLEAYGDRLEDIEVDVLEDPRREVLGEVYRAKRDLVAFRRAAWPLREVLSQLLREPSSQVGPAVRPYLRDTTDHVMQVVDVLESYRELASSLVDVYLSMLGQKTNETMRVLTVISTIFIPLTFLAGIYGMNFDTAQPGNMPELGMPYAYVAFWVVCIVVGIALLVLFRRLGWLGGDD